ncbi:MAG: hypothetical protein GWO87_01975 [Xanthomonadaceae bacterium]|nr:hypothetical protein [Rhodospirillaceae bacterium]NIA17938.1 hypothetical protein [Xanthomonadaceae bacterium]
MKILYITNNLNGKDGWSRYSRDLAQEMDSMGNNILYLVNKKSDFKNMV